MNPLATQKRRDKQAIMAEILQITRAGALKTQIMYRANLSFAQLNEYLSLMTAIGLLKNTVGYEKQTYVATAKGLEFLKRQQELMSFLAQDAQFTGTQKPQPENLLARTRKEEN